MSVKRDGKIGSPLSPADVITVVVSTATVFFVLAFGGKALEHYRLQRHLALLNSKVTSLQEENARLQKYRDYVGTAGYAEKVAREQFKLAKPGETLVIPVFRSPPVQAAASPSIDRAGQQSTPTNAATSHSFWSKWWQLLTASGSDVPSATQP